MRGLTQVEILALIRSASDGDHWPTDEEVLAVDRLIGRGLIHATQWLDFDDRHARDVNITPLGRIILAALTTGAA